MTLIQDVDIPEPTPGEQRALEAEAAVTEALQAAEAARAAVASAVAADAAGSTPQTRSAAAKARNRQAAAQSRLIESEELFERELDRLDDGDQRAETFARRQEQAAVVQVRTTIRAAIVELLSAAPAVSRLRAAQSQASLPQLDAGLERELHDLLNAGRHVREGLDRVWPKPSIESEAPR